MPSEVISQTLSIVVAGILLYFSARSIVSGRKKKSSTSGGGGLLDTAAKLAGALSQQNADDDAEKREDKIIDSWLTITEVLKETRAANTALEIERTSIRAELAESVATRDLQTGQIASLRADVDKLKAKAKQNEEAHAVALEASQRKIAEQNDTIQAQSKTIARQDATIQALREYVGQLEPLLRKAGIKTDELPRLPPVVVNGNGDSHPSGEHKRADGDDAA